MDGNLKKLHDDRILRELMGYDTLRINGTTYRNLNQLGWMFDHERLRKLFARDPVGTIHGDLTIENIICRTDTDDGTSSTRTLATCTKVRSWIMANCCKACTAAMSS